MCDVTGQPSSNNPSCGSGRQITKNRTYMNKVYINRAYIPKLQKKGANINEVYINRRYINKRKTQYN